MPNKILLTTTTSRYHRVHVLNALYAPRAKALRLHQEIGAHWLHTFRPNSFDKAPPPYLTPCGHILHGISIWLCIYVYFWTWSYALYLLWMSFTTRRLLNLQSHSWFHFIKNCSTCNFFFFLQILESSIQTNFKIGR